MNQLPTFNLKGESVEKTSLPKDFLKTVPQAFLAQAVRVYLSNQRAAGAKTKTRSDVSRTTAKMYKQKGTGRARHGSYAAPIFVGGGVSHGPTGEQNWNRRLTKKMTKRAILGAMAEKAKANLVSVIKDGNKSGIKTNQALKLFKKISGDVLVRTLLIVTSEQKDMRLSWRNIEQIELRDVSRLNPYFILPAKKILITSEAVEELVKTYDN